MLSSLIKKTILISPFFYLAYFFRFTIAGVPFTGTEIFIYFLFSFWFLSVARYRKNFYWDRLMRQYWLALFLLLAGASIGVWLAPDQIPLPSGELLNAKRAALGIWKGWVFAPMLYFVTLTQILRTAADVKILLKWFVCSSALAGLAAHGFALFGDGLTFDLRLCGFFESANYLALYLVPGLLMSVWFFLQRTYPLKKTDYLNLGSLVVLSYSLFLTKSYAGILSIFGALGLYAVYQLLRRPESRAKILAGAGLLSLLFAVALATQINTPKFRQFLDWENRSSTSVRMEIYQTSWDLVKKYPLTGHGPGLFQANYQNQAPLTLKRAPLEWNMPHPHNIFLGFWLNAGLLGLIAFILILILCHRRFTFPLIALWGIVIHGFFDMPFWKNDLAMIFWLVVGCMVVLQQKEKSQK